MGREGVGGKVQITAEFGFGDGHVIVIPCVI